MMNLNLSLTVINEKDREEIKEIIQAHCIGLFEDGNLLNAQQRDNIVLNESIVTIVALSRKYNTPILTHFVDVFTRFLIKDWHSNHFYDTFRYLVPSKFFESYKFMNYQKETSPKLYDQFYCLISTFHNRVFSFPEIGAPLFKYSDDMTEYIEITKTLNIIFSRLAKCGRDKIEIDDIQPFPSQLDVWIIPISVIQCTDSGPNQQDSNYYYSPKNEEEEEEEAKSSQSDEDNNNSGLIARFSNFINRNNRNIIDNDNNQTQYDAFNMIGNIKDKLDNNVKDGIIESYDHFIVDKDDPDWYKVFRRFFIPNKDTKVSLNPFNRYIIIIDRRIITKHRNQINVYFFKAPKGSNEINKELHPFLRVSNFFNSKSCVLPKDPKIKKPKQSRHDLSNNYDNIGLFNNVDGFMFGLSYHINSADSIACYWTTHGAGFRLFDNDMDNIWPHYFVPIPENKCCYKHYVDSKQDEEIDCNDCYQYENPEKQNQRSKRKRCIQDTLIDEPFRIFYETTTGEKLTDIYAKNDHNDEEKSDDAMEYLIQKVVKLRSNGWSKEIEIFIDYMSQYDDPNDVKDDIQDGIGDSDILDHLMSDDNQIDQNRAAQFGDEVLKLLDEIN